MTDEYEITRASRERSFYEQFGFRVVHEAEPAVGGPHVWFMRFDA